MTLQSSIFNLQSSIFNLRTHPEQSALVLPGLQLHDPKKLDCVWPLHSSSTPVQEVAPEARGAAAEGGLPVAGSYSGWLM